MSSQNPPQAVIDVTFGPLVSGIWIQQLLLGFLLAQMIDYYRIQFSEDTLFNKVIVSSLLFFNLLIAGTDFHVLYRSSVLYYGSYEYFDLQEWTMWLEPGFTAIIGFLAQLFFLMRCRQITHSNLITAILSLLLLFAFGSGLAVCGSFIKDKRFSSLGLFTTPIILWLVSTSVVDVAIAGVLCFHLFRSRTPFKKTNAVITRIMTMSMETSALTAFVAVLNLVLYLPLKNTAYHLLPQFSMSRVYTLTVMVTLLARSDLRASLMDYGTHASFSTTIREPSRTPETIKVGVSKNIENDAESGKVRSKDSFIELDEVQKPRAFAL